MKPIILEIIDEEENDLWEKKNELNTLKEKIFKTPFQLRKIKALTTYVYLKEEYIKKLRKEVKNGKNEKIKKD